MDDAAVRAEFGRLVNMSQQRLRDWLRTGDARSVGMTRDGEKVTSTDDPEAVGHHLGERIIAIRNKSSGILTEDDRAAMRKVVGYIHRHTTQRPKGDITGTRWRKSLMNWGHDPL